MCCRTATSYRWVKCLLDFDRRRESADATHEYGAFTPSIPFDSPLRVRQQEPSTRMIFPSTVETAPIQMQCCTGNY
eukprot:m.246548 g.246548  ORF g.246548 m.246548 type:complete len:76 (-) comp15856_c0_seq6:4613-4840(-)